MGGQSDTSAGGQPAGATDGQSANSAGSQSGVGSTAPSVDSEFEHPQSAEEDDGVILEDDDDEETDDDREPGQWPDEDANRSSDDRKPGAWPEVGREDEGYDAEPSDGGNADVQFGGGLTPESTADTTADDEAEFVNAEGDTLQSQSSTSGNRNELSSGFTAGSSAPSAASPSDDSDDLDAEFVCPECNFRAEVNNSSMRAGDICPECRKGYIAKE